MSGKRYPEEFKLGAVQQVAERGRSVVEVAQALGVSTHSIYSWLERYRGTEPERKAKVDQDSEVRRLKAELRRVTEERDILKKAAAYFAKACG
jgi:transposase